MITIEQGESSPYVLVDKKQHKMILIGNSFVSNPNVFYEEIVSFVETYKISGKTHFNIEITLGYFSTSNIQFFNLLFKKLNANNNSKIELYFLVDKDEEEDLEETMLSIVFNTGVMHHIKYL